MREYKFADGYVVYCCNKKYAFEIKELEKIHGKCIKKG